MEKNVLSLNGKNNGLTLSQPVKSLSSASLAYTSFYVACFANNMDSDSFGAVLIVFSSVKKSQNCGTGH